MWYSEIFHIDTQCIAIGNKKKLRKVVVGNVKCCIFAPAFPGGEGLAEAMGASSLKA